MTGATAAAAAPQPAAGHLWALGAVAAVVDSAREDARRAVRIDVARTPHREPVLVFRDDGPGLPPARVRQRLALPERPSCAADAGAAAPPPLSVSGKEVLAATPWLGAVFRLGRDVCVLSKTAEGDCVVALLSRTAVADCALSPSGMVVSSWSDVAERTAALPKLLTYSPWDSVAGVDKAFESLGPSGFLVAIFNLRRNIEDATLELDFETDKSDILLDPTADDVCPVSIHTSLRAYLQVLYLPPPEGAPMPPRLYLRGRIVREMAVAHTLLCPKDYVYAPRSEPGAATYYRIGIHSSFLGQTPGAYRPQYVTKRLSRRSRFSLDEGCDSASEAIGLASSAQHPQDNQAAEAGDGSCNGEAPSNDSRNNQDAIQHAKSADIAAGHSQMKVHNFGIGNGTGAWPDDRQSLFSAPYDVGMLVYSNGRLIYPYFRSPILQVFEYEGGELKPREFLKPIVAVVQADSWIPTPNRQQFVGTELEKKSRAAVERNMSKYVATTWSDSTHPSAASELRRRPLLWIRCDACGAWRAAKDPYAARYNSVAPHILQHRYCNVNSLPRWVCSMNTGGTSRCYMSDDPPRPVQRHRKKGVYGPSAFEGFALSLRGVGVRGGDTYEVSDSLGPKRVTAPTDSPHNNGPRKRPRAPQEGELFLEASVEGAQALEPQTCLDGTTQDVVPFDDSLSQHHRDIQDDVLDGEAFNKDTIAAHDEAPSAREDATATPRPSIHATQHDAGRDSPLARTSQPGRRLSQPKGEGCLPEPDRDRREPSPQQRLPFPATHDVGTGDDHARNGTFISEPAHHCHAPGPKELQTSEDAGATGTLTIQPNLGNADPAAHMHSAGSLIEANNITDTTLRPPGATPHDLKNNNQRNLPIRPTDPETPPSIMADGIESGADPVALGVDALRAAHAALQQGPEVASLRSKQTKPAPPPTESQESAGVTPTHQFHEHVHSRTLQSSADPRRPQPSPTTDTGGRDTTAAYPATNQAAVAKDSKSKSTNDHTHLGSTEFLVLQKSFDPPREMHDGVNGVNETAQKIPVTETKGMSMCRQSSTLRHRELSQKTPEKTNDQLRGQFPENVPVMDAINLGCDQESAPSLLLREGFVNAGRFQNGSSGSGVHRVSIREDQADVGDERDAPVGPEPHSEGSKGPTRVSNGHDQNMTCPHSVFDRDGNRQDHQDTGSIAADLSAVGEGGQSYHSRDGCNADRWRSKFLNLAYALNSCQTSSSSVPFQSIGLDDADLVVDDLAERYKNLSKEATVARAEQQLACESLDNVRRLIRIFLERGVGIVRPDDDNDEPIESHFSAYLRMIDVLQGSGDES